jgi:diacylglycerol kinase
MLISALVVILLGFILKISYFEWLIFILIITIVLSLEALNTALEKILDYLEPNLSDKIRIIKDSIAGAVAISIFASLIIGLMIFLPKIYIFLQKL